jgi:nucleoside-diphosphate-sugar epimerase
MALQCVVLGAGGLVGVRLALKMKALQKMHVKPDEEIPLKRIVLCDMRDSSKELAEVLSDSRFEMAVGDLCDKSFIEKVCTPGDGITAVTVLHIAAMLSGNSEDNFDGAMQNNLFAPIQVMETLRAVGKKLGKPQNYLFCSSDYVCCFNDFNKKNPVNENSFRLSPVSYGCQKACMEILVCDYTRKGFIDGRVARLSAVIGRPGFSNSISYPYTGIFTQPLLGKDYDCPLGFDIPYPCSSLNTNVAGILDLAGKCDVHSLDNVHFTNRVVQLPAKSFTLTDILNAAKEVAKEKGIKMGNVKKVDASAGSTTVKEINVCPYVDCSRAERLGLPMTVDLKDIIRDYVHNYVQAAPASKL